VPHGRKDERREAAERRNVMVTGDQVRKTVWGEKPRNRSKKNQGEAKGGGINLIWEVWSRTENRWGKQEKEIIPKKGTCARAEVE